MTNLKHGGDTKEPMTDTRDEELREAILTLGVCNGPYDSPHRCSALHCNHCGLCDLLEDLLQLFESWHNRQLSQAVKRAEIEARIDENQMYLDRINNFKPQPGEVTTASFGSAGAAMELSGWKHGFEDRIAYLKTNSKEEVTNE